MTFENFCALYLEHQRTYNRPSSVESCHTTLRILQRYYGDDLEVAELRPQHLHAFVAERRKTVEPVTVNKDLRVFKALLNWAVEVGYLGEMPFKVKMLRAPKKRELTPLSRTDIRKLISKAKGYQKILIHLGAVTGMRLGEMLSLRWEDIDFEGGLVTVQSENAKSHQQRSIPLGEKSLLLLREYRLRCPFNADSDLVFANRDGCRHLRSNVSRRLKKAWQDAGLYQEGVPTSHGLRHAAASSMLAAGADIESVREVLGRSTVLTTQLYCHSSDEQKRKAVGSLGL